jgi:TIR domain
MTGPKNPRVFLSHASEDKDRFVLPFAVLLREHGIDAWVDWWEMLPGDSIVTKIFTEGLENASAVIVVLSRNSLTKRWVAEELDAAVVKRINDGSRLIPVVLDGLKPSEIPTSIRHLLFENVPDTANFGPVVERIVRSIHGKPEKPALGAPPAYASTIVARIAGLDHIDCLVLKAAGDEAIRDCGTHFTTVEFLADVTSELSVADADIIESLEVLDNQGMIKISRTFGNGIEGMRSFTLTSSGLEIYCRTYRPDYTQIEQAVIARLAGWPSDQGVERDLTEAVDAPRLLVQYVLGSLHHAGLLKMSHGQSGPAGQHFFGISPRLRRLAQY